MSVLAVDGGQSGIRATASGSETIVEVDGVSRLEGDVVAVVAERVAQAWHELGEPSLERAVLGLTTSPTQASELDRLAELVSNATGAFEVRIADDTVTAHAGALSGDWGVSLTVGTGVACLAVAEDGRAQVIDGDGYLLGDDGAAFWIGREGVRAVLRAHDGRGSATSLTAAAHEFFGDTAGLAVHIHSLPRSVHSIAGFAPAVLAAAGDDRIAANIVAAAAEALAETVAAGVRATGADAVPVALGGRLIETGDLLESAVTAAILAWVPAASVRRADGSPLDGARALALGYQADRYTSLIHHWKKGSRS
jgi:glucosamine kinase